jgi:glycosyltransferase involved in cell wall biosynthesis
MRRLLVAAASTFLEGISAPARVSIFVPLVDLGYSLGFIVISSHDHPAKVTGNFSVLSVSVRKWFPAATMIYVYIRFLQLVLRDSGQSVVILSPMLFPLLVPLRILRGNRSLMLIRSSPIGNFESLVGWLRFQQFRLALMVAKHFAAAITATTPLEVEEFARLAKADKSKFAVIPSAINPIFTKRRDHVHRDELRRRLGMTDLIGKKVVLHHGVLSERRGIMQLLDAFANVFQKSDDPVLLVVGEGPARHLIETHIRDKGMTNCLVKGPVPYSVVPDLISACDLGLVVLPDNQSWRYACPLKLIELFVMGKAVVASDLPGIRWGAGNSALVTYVKRFDDPKALGNAITNALSQTPKAPQDESFLETFTSKRIASRLDALIREKCG